MTIKKLKDPAVAAGAELHDILSRYRQIPVLLLVSGGSAFFVLQHCDPAAIGPNVTIGVLDERFSSDPLINNYLQLKKTDFFIQARRSGAKSIDSSLHEDESQRSLSVRIETSILDWIMRRPNGKIIVTMGIGEDGHTAGILPRSAAADLDETKQVVAYSVAKEINPHTERVTVSLAFLRDRVDEAIVYAVGEKKHQILETLQDKDMDLYAMPARILNEMRSVTIFTDMPACAS